VLKANKFKEINLNDNFFDSLKADYAEFSDWFARKAEETAYVFYGEDESIEGFLYLKSENGPIEDVSPALPDKRRIKVGTFKINPHGTRLGERFIKKIFDHAIANDAEEIYVTAFQKHEALINLLQRYGFKAIARKSTSNGDELVLLKQFNSDDTDALLRYPQISITKNSYLLSLYPEWHTRLLPDSILRNESSTILEDISHTNSIHKVYLAAMRGMEALQRGDNLVIYRTSDEPGRAWYRAVATTICVVEEYRNISSFADISAFLKYCEPYSVFTPEELNQFWRTRRFPHVIRFSYNIALPRRLTRGHLVDNIGLSESAYWGFMPLSQSQFKQVLQDGGVNENLIVD